MTPKPPPGKPDCPEPPGGPDARERAYRDERSSPLKPEKKKNGDDDDEEKPT